MRGVDSILPHWLIYHTYKKVSNFEPHSTGTGNVFIDNNLYTKVFYYFIILFSLHRKLLSFIMVPVVQRELDTFKEMVWNSHRIRAQKDTVLPDGVPNHIYNFPQKYGLEECGNIISLRSCLHCFRILVFKVIWHDHSSTT